jgi:hypothetical protein
MILGGPLELGLPTAISNWFIRRWPLGLAVGNVAKGAALAVMPLAARAIIIGWDWPTTWIFLGVLMRGRRSVWDGRAQIRAAVYMATLDGHPVQSGDSDCLPTNAFLKLARPRKWPW